MTNRPYAYADPFLASAHGQFTPAREIWRNLMGTGLRHFRGFVAESFRDEGRVEGRLEGRAEDILRILDLRGVPVPEAARQRVSACTDLAVLDVWFERAVTAPSADAVFGDG
ncbi:MULTISPECIES: hypothetical protein [Streptomyces]|uniref:hypothetical protein n=1 Tax=Streptomyces TaxID=1883 RepID=UPI001F3CE2E0|nr:MULTISPECIES: hypothetical protein [Streptomyces]